MHVTFDSSKHAVAIKLSKNHDLNHNDKLIYNPTKLQVTSKCSFSLPTVVVIVVVAVAVGVVVLVAIVTDKRLGILE